MSTPGQATRLGCQILLHCYGFFILMCNFRALYLLDPRHDGDLAGEPG